MPSGTWAVCLLGGFAWMNQKLSFGGAIFTGVCLLVLTAASAYQTGYKGFFVAGRKTYFALVFAAPALVCILGLVVGLAVHSSR